MSEAIVVGDEEVVLVSVALEVVAVEMVEMLTVLLIFVTIGVTGGVHDRSPWGEMLALLFASLKFCMLLPSSSSDSIDSGDMADVAAPSLSL